MGVWLSGTDHARNGIERQIALVTDSDGPAIPTTPAVLLAKKLIDHGSPKVGAFPCLGLVTLSEIADYLHGHSGWLVSGSAGIWDQTPISTLG